MQALWLRDGTDDLCCFSFAVYDGRLVGWKTVKQEVARTSQASPYRDGLSSGAWNEIFIKVANQLDAVHSSATRISSSAESLGAVEYEARLSAAVQVLILYVDHIKVRT